ncbi:TPA: hypothetical protein N2D16_002843 [Clostridium botulinum]|nr:hypothetical protein [Clostridium botulinum]HCL4455219.1 hypothetical protein [Clostridium botulinum]
MTDKNLMQILNDRLNKLKDQNPSVGSENWARIEELQDIIKIIRDNE